MPSPASSSLALNKTRRTPSPLAVELIPRLVPESDEGNVEYKLQLLNPSSSRFARLVTQLKWRLLEGGGQAYYELGVADSGDLVGLSRDELERSLETLEMMAGEIGASVIVVKEIEIPGVLATLVRTRESMTFETDGSSSSFTSVEGYSSATETETEGDSLSGTDADDEALSRTVTLAKPPTESGSTPIFSMDSDTDDAPNVTQGDNLLSIPCQSHFRVDLEISSVFKPRPMKTRAPNQAHSHLGGKNKRNKKEKLVDSAKGPATEDNLKKIDKSLQRRQHRDRRREENRKFFDARATHVPFRATSTLVPAVPEIDTLTNSLTAIHLDELPLDTARIDHVEDDDCEVFSSPKHDLPSIPTFSTGESHLKVDTVAIAGAVGANANGEEKRLIVEALVVRKMSHHEAFLDFGGFSLI
jgi:hypothetical protein